MLASQGHPIAKPKYIKRQENISMFGIGIQQCDQVPVARGVRSKKRQQLCEDQTIKGIGPRSCNASSRKMTPATLPGELSCGEVAPTSTNT